MFLKWLHKDKTVPKALLPRRFTRLNRVLSVRSKDLRTHRATTRDISLSGLKLVTSENLEPRRALELIIDLECGLEPAKAEGVVVWTNQETREAGIVFSHVPGPDLERIQRFIASIENTRRKVLKD
ncbi:MAG: PilZ domain-containing protein [Armatimonadetes bacterium]|nr:PilZ domain-containing protein [Armatimonadota bacterium]